MKIYKSISHLYGREQDGMRVITKKFVENLQPEAIFCIGNRMSQIVNRSCFIEGKRHIQESLSYDFFIIINDEDALDEKTALAVANRLINSQYKVNIILHKKGFVLKELEAGNFFFSWAIRTAIVIYDKYGVFKQIPKVNKNKCSEVFPETHLKYLMSMSESTEAIATASQHLSDKNFYLAVLALQKAAFFSLKALMTIAIGYDASNLSLHGMICLSKNFTNIVSAVFCIKMEEEHNLYKLITSSPEKLSEMMNNTQHFEIQLLRAKVKRLKQSVNDYQFKNNTLLKHSTTNQ